MDRYLGKKLSLIHTYMVEWQIGKNLNVKTGTIKVLNGYNEEFIHNFGTGENVLKIQKP